MTSEAEVTSFLAPLAKYNKDPTNTMRACEWQGAKNMVVNRARPKPLVSHPRDAIVRMTHVTVCGSDLHIYHHEFKGVKPGDILGHEGVGIVESVGSEVKDFKAGDRVVLSAVIACGACSFCKAQMFSLCDTTNPGSPLVKVYGASLSGIFGYTHYLGGFDGMQAEFVRVPLSDVNLLKLHDSIPSEVGVLLSDIACTSWHANELAEVSPNQSVAVWGAGPVGLLTLFWAKHRGAKTLISIDCDEYRLSLAAEKFGAITINFAKDRDVVAAIKRHLPNGPDVGIEAAGFRFPKSFIDRAELALGLETDTPEILTEVIKSVRKAGHIAIIGDYFFTANNFPIGAMMEKGLTVRGGQVYVQKYWKQVSALIAGGKTPTDISFVISHKMAFDKIADAYEIFDKHLDRATKIILQV